LDFAGQHPLRLSEVVKVVRPAFAISDGKSRAATSAARSPDTLRVVKCFGWHIPKENRVEITEINAKLEGGRAA
jgi:hypothetical protein